MHCIGVVLVLSAALAASARPAAPWQAAEDEAAPAACTLPDLSRMHAATRSQLGDAYRELEAAEPAGRPGAPAAASDPRRGEAHGVLGMLLLAADYPDAAGRCLRNATRLAPGEFRWPYYLGHVHIRLGDLDRAVESFERALTIDPDDLAALVWLVHVRVDLDEPAEAEQLLARAWASHPGTPALLYQGGRAALAAQEYAAAAARLEEALRLNPAATVIHYPLAMAYRGLGDLDRARAHLDRGGARSDGRGAEGGVLPDPLMAEIYTLLRSPQSHRDLGLQAAERGDWREAARQFTLGARMAPDNPVMRLNLGTALIRTGDAPAALTQLEAAASLDPGFAAPHFLIGTLLERSGRDGEAIDRFRMAADADASLSAAHLRLGDALRRTGRFEAALFPYRQVQGEQARFGEAMALVRLGRYGEALQVLDAAAERYPGEPSFPHARARLLAAAPDDGVRDGVRALAVVEGLVTEGYRTAGVAETMAMALAELGRFAEAVEWQGRAMQVAAGAARGDVARGMSANLALYQRNEPCRTPWRNDEPEHNPGPAVDPDLLAPGPGD
ncbi:MAG: tetratricopeptide repeat protein [Acidobacteria bacterium]|nr:tetratricopeptide repeat protein [Acidobacteriota bacterium]